MRTEECSLVHESHLLSNDTKYSAFVELQAVYLQASFAVQTQHTAQKN